jgi:D-alanine-D-alanine ligase
MSRTIVGVLRGGTSNEYPLSLKTGAAILDALPDEQYNTRDIFIDKRGLWHVRGIPMEPARALSQVDVVLSGLHGGVGEDGTVARLLRRMGVPFAGSEARASALSLNKIRAREALAEAGVLIPRSVAFTLGNGMHTGQMAGKVFEEFGPPYILKPALEGASHGIRIADTILELPDAIGDILDAYGAVIVEEFVFGDEATVGIIEDFRGEELYALPPARVSYPQEARHVHHTHHHEGLVRYFAPSDFSHGEKQSLIDAARTAHRALDLADFSRADFILTRRGPYLLEMNALPGLHEHAALPPMLESVGSSVKDFVAHAIGLSRR